MDAQPARRRQPRVTAAHEARLGHFIARLGAIVGPPFDLGREGPGGWYLLASPEVRLAGDAVVPAFAGWRVASVPGWPMIDAPPDWLCDVQSPSTPWVDYLSARQRYARAGVRHVWFAHPIEHTLEVFTHANSSAHLRFVMADDPGLSEIRVAPFDALPLDLRQLWPERAAASPAE